MKQSILLHRVGACIAAMLIACGSQAGDTHSHRPQTSHVHGSAALNIVTDGAAIHIELISPAANLVGFEALLCDVATRPGDGRIPQIELNEAGLRKLPPMSEPCASHAMPVASDTAAPPGMLRTDVIRPRPGSSAARRPSWPPPRRRRRG